jgi:hypothetical protein
MAITHTDVSIAANGDIRWTGGGATYYTVLELRRFLGDLADDAVSANDDYVDITSFTPAERSTDNIITLNDHTVNGGPQYNIDDAMAEHLYDGSITQKNGDEQYGGLVVVGALFGTTTLQIIQNNGYYDGVAPFWGTGINTDPANNILLRTLIKVRTSGANIDGKKIRVIAREWGHSYAEFSVTMGLGNATAAIFTVEDLNNATSSSVIGAMASITNVEGYQLIDLNNGAGNRPYYSKWTKGTEEINDLFEYTKWASVRGATGTLHGITGDLFRGITTQWDYTGEATGPFVEDEILAWGSGTTAGTGLLLALKDDGTTGTHWIQLLTGVNPSLGAIVTGLSSAAEGQVWHAVTTRSVSPTFFGVSTGNSIIGAFGIGVNAGDLTSLDKLFDLTNTQQQPPNNVTFTVSSVLSGEDYVLVGPATGASNDLLYYAQLSASGTNATGATVLHVQETIPLDSPVTGTVRGWNAAKYDRNEYDSFSGNTFSITGAGLPATVVTGADVWISYIDRLATGTTAGTTTSESFVIVFSSPRNVFIRVRDGGVSPIKTFESPGTIGSAGGAVSAIRTSDL